MDILTIMCSSCGKKERFGYSAENVNGAVKRGWNSFGGALYCPECSATWEERNGADRKMSGAENTVRLMDEFFERQQPRTVTEFCPECEMEITMQWDVERDGFKAFCPNCGNRLMLCDECKHRSGNYRDDCDYDGMTDTCKFNREDD